MGGAGDDLVLPAVGLLGVEGVPVRVELEGLVSGRSVFEVDERSFVILTPAML